MEQYQELEIIKRPKNSEKSIFYWFLSSNSVEILLKMSKMTLSAPKKGLTQHRDFDDVRIGPLKPVSSHYSNSVSIWYRSTFGIKWVVYFVRIPILWPVHSQIYLPQKWELSIKNKNYGSQKTKNRPKFLCQDLLLIDKRWKKQSINKSNQGNAKWL